MRVLAWTAVAVALSLGLLVVTTPDVDMVATRDPATTAFIERAKARGIAVDWRPVPLERIDIDLQLAILVSEDLRFFQHHGFDWHEIRAAAWEALTGKRLRGASTITQQLARFLWLSRRRTPLRKAREAVIAWKLEHRLSKRRILELYLNTAIFGRDVVGVEAAAQRYFGISAAEVTPLQAARLAATLPAPTHWYPGTDSPKAARQVARILQRMQWPTGLRERLEALSAPASASVASRTDLPSAHAAGKISP